MMNKSKKLLVFTLMFAMLSVMFSGCQANTNKEDQTSSSSTATESSEAVSTTEAASTEKAADKITVTDGDGKTFSFDKPITKAVVYDRFNTEVFRAVGAYDVMVGVDQDAVDSYPSAWTGVGEKIQIVGRSCTDFNVEMVAQMKPDAVFTSSLGEYESMRDQLEKFNIPVVVVDAWKPSEYYGYIELVGDVTGHSAQAAEYIKFCKDAIKAVEEGLATIPEAERKTVYFENSNNGPYKSPIPGSGWHDMIVSAGGINIFGDIKFDKSDKSKGSSSSYEIDPEAIIQANPDVLIDNIYSTKQHNKLGPTIKLEENELVDELANFANRPGWSNLKAVQNKEVYGFTSFLGDSNSKLIGIMYIAKWLYPETFTDLDPDAFFQQWCDYMGLKEIQNQAAKIQ